MTRLAATLVFALLPAAISAHHSVVAYYDTNTEITLKGAVTKIEWANPHAFVYLDVRDERGTVTNWAVETDSPKRSEPRRVVEIDAEAGRRGQRHRLSGEEAACSAAARDADARGRPPVEGMTFVIRCAACIVVASISIPAVAQRHVGGRDLTGVWIGPYTPNLARGITLSFQPGAEATFRNHRGEDDPTARCLPPGVPRVLGSPFPIEILQDATSVTILYEYMHLIRRIPTDGRKHPDDLDATFMGDSVGRWEGDTLVVDATGFNDRTWLDTEGHQHSDALHVVERFHRVASDTMGYDVTIDDPKTYKQAWSASRTLTRHPDWTLKEYVCEENNKIK